MRLTTMLYQSIGFFGPYVSLAEWRILVGEIQCTACCNSITSPAYAVSRLSRKEDPDFGKSFMKISDIRTFSGGILILALYYFKHSEHMIARVPVSGVAVRCEGFVLTMPLPVAQYLLMQ
jgi:hypothetical protein